MTDVSPEIKTAAIIPAYNEERRVGGVIHSAFRSEYVDLVIVVNDGSSDDTANSAALAARSAYEVNPKPHQVFSNPQNIGKTETLKAGIELACKIGGEALKTLVVLDADSLPRHSRRTLENMKLWQIWASKLSANSAQFLTPELMEGRNNIFLTSLARYIDEMAEPVISGQEIRRTGIYERNFIMDTASLLLQEGGHGGNQAFTRKVWQGFIAETDKLDKPLGGWEIEGALTAYVKRQLKEDPTLKQGVFVMDGIVNVGSRVKAGGFLPGLNRMLKIHTQATRGLTRFRT